MGRSVEKLVQEIKKLRERAATAGGRWRYRRDPLELREHRIGPYYQVVTQYGFVVAEGLHDSQASRIVRMHNGVVGVPARKRP